MSLTLRFVAPLEAVFIEEGFDPAYFLTLPPGAVEQIAAHEQAGRLERGSGRAFGAVPVTVRIGGSNWQTKLNRKGDVLTLPIRKPVRLAEGLAEGEAVEAEIELG